MEVDVPTIYKNFEVVCGQKATDYFKIENNSKINKTYEVVSMKKSNGIDIFDCRLQVHPYKIIALPGKTIRFLLTYLSYTENVIENFVYHIFESEKLVTKLIVHAKSVGPLLHVKVYNLKFFCFREVSQTVKNIELQNKTKCEAKYHFDIDDDHSLVQVSQPTGIIPGDVKINLKLTFMPPSPGVYYKQIFCIVQFHDPIVLNILGVSKPKVKMNPRNLTFKYPPIATCLSNYEEYMKKSNQNIIGEEEKMLDLPKCHQEGDKSFDESTIIDESSEDKKYWMVSFCESSQEDSTSSAEKISNEIILTNYFFDVRNVPEVHKATTLVNLSNSQHYYYQWDHDPKNHFQIEPCKGVLEPSRKVDFSIYFTPSAPDFLYHIEVDLRVFPYYQNTETLAQECVDLPMTMSLRIIGNSFPTDSFGWVPQCIIVPKFLHLPSCVPGEVVFGTFMIERRGHLPVTFAVIYPKESCYIVQPPVGYLSGNFQLFVIQFNNKLQDEGVYKEDLKIIYNDSNSNYDFIRVITSVEIPKLIFEESNYYEFKPLFPGSKSAAKISVENPTNLHLSYNFDVPEEINWIQIPNPSGTIEPTSAGEVEVIFKPETPCEYLGTISCRVSTMSMKEYSNIVELKIMGSCQYGYLVATPSMHNFGECVYCEEKHVKIHVYNFSPVVIFFELFATSKDIYFGDAERDIKITPLRGCVNGKGSFEVIITATAHHVHSFQYEIFYKILENDSEEALSCEKPKKIFSLEFQGVLPTCQIIDINVDGGGPLFSPHWIWKMMSINRINKALKSLSQEDSIKIRCPEAMVNMGPITIALLIEANRYGDVYWKINKSVQCSCFEDSGDTIDKKDNCFHFKALTLSPTEFKLSPKQRIILQIVLNYKILGTSQVQLIINMPRGRKVILDAVVVSLPDSEEPFTSMYLHPTIQLKPVFIGDVMPPVQLFWLYNNTCHPASYVVDKLTLREATAFVHGIFDCINPNGVISPFSCVPLAFLFKPIEIRSYKVEIAICLQEENLTTLCLEGDGLCNNQKFLELPFEKTIPEKPILYNTNLALECSVNLLSIKFLQTFSKSKRIFLLRNRSQTDVWAFQWHNFAVEDLIQAWVEPSNGILEPGKETTMILNLKTFSHPTLISFSLPCDVINYSELKIYESALRHQDIMMEKQKDYFTITEKGISYEKQEVPIPNKPEPYHLFVSVNAKVISIRNVDQNLTVEHQFLLKASEKTKPINLDTISIDSSLVLKTQELLEKMLWSILNSDSFRDKISNLKGSEDYNYLQIVNGNKKHNKEASLPPPVIPDKNFVQNFLEDALGRILNKNFVHNACNV